MMQKISKTICPLIAVDYTFATKMSAALMVAAAAGLAHGTPSVPTKKSSSRHEWSGKKLRTNVIVKLDGAMNPTREKRLAKFGFDKYRSLSIINSVAGSMPTKNIRSLLALDFVQHISDDVQTRKTDAFTTGSTYAPTAWAQYKTVGQGVGVAVLDSGVSNLPDFRSLAGLLGIVPVGSRIQGQIDFSGEGVQDKCGHGTHVAGLIAGDASNSFGVGYTQSFLGIAPGCNLYNVKVLDKTGAGVVSNAIAAVQWVVANKAKYNLRVINLSLGHPVGESYKTDPLCQAVESAWKAGIVVVCAAGNDGRLNASPSVVANNSGYGTNYWSVECPGNDPYVITVGATKQEDSNRADDQIASYSGRGPARIDNILKPDIIAPGNLITSTEDTGNSYLVTTYGSQIQILNSSYMTLGSGYSKTYFKLSGTSMATPVVSGAAALILALQPNLSPDTVKARLMISATKWTDPSGNGDPCTYGAGYLNIPAAITNTAVATGYALSPTLSEDNDGNVYMNLDSSIYGQRAMWGTGSATTDVYGQRAMWGTAGNQLSSSRAMWGTGGWTNDSTSNQASGGIDCSTSSIIIRGEK